MKRSMNTSFRLVWNESTQTWCVAHEMARGRGKGGARLALRPVHAAIMIIMLAAGSLNATSFEYQHIPSKGIFRVIRVDPATARLPD
jgi:hypothetical protein